MCPEIGGAAASKMRSVMVLGGRDGDARSLANHEAVRRVPRGSSLGSARSAGRAVTHRILTRIAKDGIPTSGFSIAPLLASAHPELVEGRLASAHPELVEGRLASAHPSRRPVQDDGKKQQIGARVGRVTPPAANLPTRPVEPRQQNTWLSWQARQAPAGKCEPQFAITRGRSQLAWWWSPAPRSWRRNGRA